MYRSSFSSGFLPVIAVLLLVASTCHACQSISTVGHRDSKLETIRSPPSQLVNLYKKYQPALKLKNACAPHPAVGTCVVSGGLKPTGSWTGKCGKSGGQVYARHQNLPRKSSYVCKRWKTGTGVRAIVYGYYFPKDSWAHRHDWEAVVVWVSWDWKKVLGASLSRHGQYAFFRNQWIGNHKKVLYSLHGTSQAMRNPTFDKSGYYYKHPLANWYQLPKDIRTTLNKGQFGGSPCPVKDGRFGTELNRAFKSACNYYNSFPSVHG